MAKSRSATSPPAEPTEPKLITKKQARVEFSHRLRQLMLKKGLRNADLARMADLERNAISTYLNQKSLPTPTSLRAIARALKTDPAELLPAYQAGVPQSRMSSSDNEIEMEISSSNPKLARLRISRTLPTTLALNILKLIEAQDAKEAE